MNIDNFPNYEDFKSTRDYMQDVVKIMGALQQKYSEKQGHYWHMGVLVESGKIISQKLGGDYSDKMFKLDFGLHLFHTPWGTINLTNKSPDTIFLEASGLSESQIKMPDFTAGDANSYSDEHAKVLTEVFTDMNDLFTQIKSKTTVLMTSPILLYPHHFDLSLVLFLQDDDEHQVGIGFSTGDEAIDEPYIYVLTGPYHDSLSAIDVPAFVSVETEAYAGLIIKLSSLSKVDQPDEELLKFFKQIATSVESI